MLENRPLQRQFNAKHNTGEKHNTQNRPLVYDYLIDEINKRESANILYFIMSRGAPHAGSRISVEMKE